MEFHLLYYHVGSVPYKSGRGVPISECCPYIFKKNPTTVDFYSSIISFVS